MSPHLWRGWAATDKEFRDCSHNSFRIALQLSRGPRTHDSSLAQHSGALRIAREQITQAADDLMNGLTVGAWDAARDEAAMGKGGRAPPLRAAMPSRSLRTMSLSRAPQLQASMGNFRWPFNTGTPIRRRWRPSRRRNYSWPWCPTDIRGLQRSRDEINGGDKAQGRDGEPLGLVWARTILKRWSYQARWRTKWRPEPWAQRGQRR